LERASSSLTILDECVTSSFMPQLGTMPRLVSPGTSEYDVNFPATLGFESIEQSKYEEEIDRHKLDYFKPVTGIILLSLLAAFEEFNGKLNLMYRLVDGSLKISTATSHTAKIDTDAFLLVKRVPGIAETVVDYNNDFQACTFFLSRGMRGEKPCGYPFPEDKCNALKLVIKPHLGAGHWPNYQELLIRLTNREYSSVLPAISDIPQKYCALWFPPVIVPIVKGQEDVKICDSCIAIVKRYFSRKSEIPSDTVVEKLTSSRLLTAATTLYNHIFLNIRPAKRESKFESKHWRLLDSNLHVNKRFLDHYHYPGTQDVIPGPLQVELGSDDAPTRKKAFCKLILPKCTVFT